jgi:hypothetical protein
VKNIERPVKVTHLLCSGDEETEKMRYAEKFNKKGESKICMVWEEWFWDSLDFGGVQFTFTLTFDGDGLWSDIKVDLTRQHIK